jgi:hypothetical protein
MLDNDALTAIKSYALSNAQLDHNLERWHLAAQHALEHTVPELVEEILQYREAMRTTMEALEGFFVTDEY